MRLIAVLGLAAGLWTIAAAPVLAQGQRVIIEDDVSSDNAMRCAALRLAQVSAAERGGAPATPHVLAAWEAWLKSLLAENGSGVRDQIAARARSLRTDAAGLRAMAEDCAAFEIRAIERPVG